MKEEEETRHALKINDDDDELLVRACAVLKSQGQGAENWSRGRPGHSDFFCGVGWGFCVCIKERE